MSCGKDLLNFINSKQIRELKQFLVQQHKDIKVEIVMACLNINLSVTGLNVFT